MTTRKFLTSVADVYAYDSSDQLVFTAKTLLDSSIEVSLGNAPVRGGRGNQLQYIYYHTGEMKFTLTDTQWNLAMLAATVGEDLAGQADYYQQETIAVSAAGSGTLNDTAKAFTGTTIYAWGTDPNGITYNGTVGTGGTVFQASGATSFTAGNWCVRYYTTNLTEGRSFTITANMIPKVVKLVMETQLNSADVTTNKIGIVQIIAPTVTLSGAFTISMKSDGVANTPLTGTALAYTGAPGTDACSSEPYYAKVIEIIDDTDWYDNVYALSISGGDFSLGTFESETLTVFGIPTNGTSFIIPNNYLTFASSSLVPIVVVSASGVVTAGSATGSGSVIVSITAASLVETHVHITIV